MRRSKAQESTKGVKEKDDLLYYSYIMNYFFSLFSLLHRDVRFPFNHRHVGRVTRPIAKIKQAEKAPAGLTYLRYSAMVRRSPRATKKSYGIQSQKKRTRNRLRMDCKKGTPKRSITIFKTHEIASYIPPVALPHRTANVIPNSKNHSNHANGRMYQGANMPAAKVLRMTRRST